MIRTCASSRSGRRLLTGGAGLALALLLCAGPGLEAGVVVTNSRQVQVGEVSDAGDSVAVRGPFGLMAFRKGTVKWFSVEPAIDSLLKAGYAAQAAGEELVALHLFMLSQEQETATRAQARAAIDALQKKHRPAATAPASAPAPVTAAAPAPAPKTANAVLKELKGDLVRLKDGRRLQRVAKDALPDVDYYGIYFSAHWCGPCRQFTPRLVEFYNDLQPAHGKRFEIIFVSLDQSADAMEGYMQEAQMPWPAIEFASARKTDLRRYAGRGIPCLVLLDRGGAVLADSYTNGQYVGPTVVMEQLRKRLTEGAD
jgi:nucleoredoxin